MTYATREDLEDAFGTDEIRQLADRDHSGEPDETFVSKTLAWASDLIDGYLKARYALPLDQPYPPVIVATTCDLARWRLYTVNVPDAVQRTYELALSWLQAVSAGKTLLQLPGTTSNLETGSPVFSAPDRLFSAGTLADF